MESSILGSIGQEIIGVMSPVSLCMLLVVLLVYSLSPSNPFSSSSPAPIRTAANLVYLENPSDSAAQKLEGALLNALVFVVLIAIVTFVLVVLYYYNFTNFLKNYMRFSGFFVLGKTGTFCLVFYSLVKWVLVYFWIFGIESGLFDLIRCLSIRVSSYLWWFCLKGRSFSLLMF